MYPSRARETSNTFINLLAQVDEPCACLQKTICECCKFGSRIQYRSHTNPISNFPNDVPLEIRVEAIPVVNAMIKSFEDGEINDGDAFFQDVLVEKIRQAKLLEHDVWVQVEQAGVHDLLLRECSMMVLT